MIKFDKKYISTHTLAECLAKYDCSYHRLWTYCKFRGIKYLKNKQAKRAQYVKFNEQLKELAGTDNDVVIAEKIGCQRMDVFNYRAEHNIKPCGKRLKTVKWDIGQILSEYNELGSLQKVADKHNVTRERVRQWFRDAGYRYEKGIGYIK